MQSDDTAPILLYDGLCGFCDGTVRFVLARDAEGAMRFAALQGDFGRSVLARHPQLRGIDSLVVVEPAAAGRPERILTRSDGALRIASYLGGAWRLLAVLRIIPRPLRDVLYDAFARVRYRLFGRLDVCAVPPPEFRGRFVT